MGENETQEKLFHKASELPEDVYGRAKNDLLSMLESILQIGKEYRKDGEAIKAYLRLGPFEASFETVPQPVTGTGGRRRAPPKPLNLLGAQGIVAEYPDLLEQPVDAVGFWFIKPKKDLGDSYSEINRKLRDVGFIYTKWQKDVEYTKGWRGKK